MQCLVTIKIKNPNNLSFIKCFDPFSGIIARKSKFNDSKLLNWENAVEHTTWTVDVLFWFACCFFFP